MEWVVVCARLLLMAVFSVAAVAKVLDREGTRRSLGEFRVPAPLIAGAAWLLPAVELIAAFGLLFEPTARIAGAAIVALLAAFSVGVTRAMARGEHPECHCFGQLQSEPAGRATLVRNAAFAVLAVLVAAGSHQVAISAWLGARSAAELAALALGAVTLAALLYIRHLLARLSDVRGALRADGGSEPLALGEPAPPFRATDLAGTPVTEADLAVGGLEVVIVFVSAGCPACDELLPTLSSWQRTLAGAVRIVVVHAGDEDRLSEVLDRHPLSPLVLDPVGDIIRAYRAPATPSALRIDARGRVASRPQTGPLAVEGLVRMVLRDGNGDHASASLAVP